jgi:hypothetical protein
MATERTHAPHRRAIVYRGLAMKTRVCHCAVNNLSVQSASPWSAIVT